MKTDIYIGVIYLSGKYDCFFCLDWDIMTIYIKNDKTIKEYVVYYDDFTNIFEEYDFDTLEDEEIAQFIEDNLDYFLTNIIKAVDKYGSLKKTVVYNTHCNLSTIFTDLLYHEFTDDNYNWVD